MRRPVGLPDGDEGLGEAKEALPDNLRLGEKLAHLPRFARVDLFAHRFLTSSVGALEVNMAEAMPGCER
ncbi:MAG: hypothetical protein WBE20_11485 [Candidatus Acidiferrales bacterium]